jgi:hypothetical protein
MTALRGPSALLRSEGAWLLLYLLLFELCLASLPCMAIAAALGAKGRACCCVMAHLLPHHPQLTQLVRTLFSYKFVPSCSWCGVAHGLRGKLVGWHLRVISVQSFRTAVCACVSGCQGHVGSVCAVVPAATIGGRASAANARPSRCQCTSRAPQLREAACHLWIRAGLSVVLVFRSCMAAGCGGVSAHSLPLAWTAGGNFGGQGWGLSRTQLSGSSFALLGHWPLGWCELLLLVWRVFRVAKRCLSPRTVPRSCLWALGSHVPWTPGGVEPGGMPAAAPSHWGFSRP